MDKEVNEKFRDMAELISMGYSESKQLKKAKENFKYEWKYQSLDQYLDLKRSISNILYEVNSNFSRIVQLSLEEGIFGRIYIKMRLTYYSIKVRPLIWLQEKNM